MGYNKDVQQSNQQLKVRPFGEFRPFGEPPSLKPSPLPDLKHKDLKHKDFKLPDFYYGPFKPPPPDFTLTPDFTLKEKM